MDVGLEPHPGLWLRAEGVQQPRHLPGDRHPADVAEWDAGAVGQDEQRPGGWVQVQVSAGQAGRVGAGWGHVVAEQLFDRHAVWLGQPGHPGGED